MLHALENEFARIERDQAAADPVKTLAERMKTYSRSRLSQPPTWLEADKAFFDDLSGDL